MTLTDMGRRIEVVYHRYDASHCDVNLTFIEAVNGDWLLLDKYGSFD